MTEEISPRGKPDARRLTYRKPADPQTEVKIPAAWQADDEWIREANAEADWLAEAHSEEQAMLEAEAIQAADDGT